MYANPKGFARPRVIRGTRIKPLPLLPSGPGGVHSHPLHEARSLTTSHASMRVKFAPPRLSAGEIRGHIYSHSIRSPGNNGKRNAFGSPASTSTGVRAPLSMRDNFSILGCAATLPRVLPHPTTLRTPLTEISI